MVLALGLPLSHAERPFTVAGGPVASTPTSAVPADAGEAARAAVASHFAPTIYQETKDQRDLIAAMDFDGDWDLTNNASHVDGRPMPAVVYDTVVETPTHWFLTYLPYHPVDAKGVNGHDNDTEHATMVVRKDGSAFGRLEAMEVRFHDWMYQYAAPGSGVGDAADDVDGPIHFDTDGRPMINAQRVGHGLCGGLAPTLPFFDSLALRCRHRDTPRIARQGVVYRYKGRAEAPRSLDDRDVGYALVEIGEQVWPRARDAGALRVFATRMDFRGERCTEYDCPRGIGAVLASAVGHGSTGMPWEEGPGKGVSKAGDPFFDPAYTLGRRLRFPAPFAIDYSFNPYLGVGSFPDTALAAH